jgi:hypothetical protein
MAAPAPAAMPAPVTPPPAAQPAATTAFAQPSPVSVPQPVAHAPAAGRVPAPLPVPITASRPPAAAVPQPIAAPAPAPQQPTLVAAAPSADAELAPAPPTALPAPAQHEDDVELALSVPAHAHHEEVVHVASGRWFSPGTALVAAMAALAWRLVDAYAHTILPDKVDSGASLDRFDTIVNQLPIAGNIGGTVLGYVLIVAAGGLVVAGWRMRVREPLLQLAVVAVTLLALAGPFLAVR